MNRLTKLEIQRALLAGAALSWTNAAGKTDSLELEDPISRRLFGYLLQSEVRDPKGLADGFLAGLAKAFVNQNDASDEVVATPPVSPSSGPWRLQRIETEGFGGLNRYGGGPFALDLDGESLLLQGPNGSGKSSLVGAVLWALTGDRLRDHSDARPEVRAEVFADGIRPIGTWPPVACYPDDPAGLGADPYVRVTLTFVDPAGATGKVERQLKGRVIEHRDAAVDIPDILLETGVLMPSRMPQIRLAKGPSRLTDAVQRLTGLDDLIDIGVLVEGLCHRSREYLSTYAKDAKRCTALFEAALAETVRALERTDETVAAFRPKDTEDKDGPMAAFGKHLRERAAELTHVIVGDLTPGLDLASAKVQLDLAGAISGAREELGAGLDGLQGWKELSQIAGAITPEVATFLGVAAETAEKNLAEALQLARRAEADSRLQLKALAARWHEAHRHGAVVDCPLCDRPLDDAALAAEIETLRQSDEAATRQLSDNLNSIQAQLDAAVPSAIVRRLFEVGAFAPRQRLIDEISAR
jgi:hypothetical protein